MDERSPEREGGAEGKGGDITRTALAGRGSDGLRVIGADGVRPGGDYLARNQGMAGRDRPARDMAGTDNQGIVSRLCFLAG